MIRLPKNEVNQNLTTYAVANNKAMRLLSYVAANNDEAINTETESNDTNNADATKKGTQRPPTGAAANEKVASDKSNDNEATALRGP